MKVVDSLVIIAGILISFQLFESDLIYNLHENAHLNAAERGGIAAERVARDTVVYSKNSNASKFDYDVMRSAGYATEAHLMLVIFFIAVWANRRAVRRWHWHPFALIYGLTITYLLQLLALTPTAWDYMRDPDLIREAQTLNVLYLIIMVPVAIGTLKKDWKKWNQHQQSASPT